MRTCTKCSLDKEPGDFYKGRTECKTCSKQQSKAWRQSPAGKACKQASNASWKASLLANKARWQRTPHGRERVRSNRMKSKYGITLLEYNKMLAEQDGKCAICQRPENGKDRYGNPRPLSIDHHHESGKVRKLLCNKCNFMIGLAMEDTAILSRCINYLQEFQDLPGGQYTTQH